MTDSFTNRLSEYLDDDLTPGERLDVERHLLDCAECRAALDGLRRVVADAQTLEDTPPVNDLWSGVRAALPATPQRRFITMSIPQALAAGIFLAIVSGLCVALFLDRQYDGQTGSLFTDRTPITAAVPASLADPKYDQAVDELTKVLAEERARLSPKTIAALERSLATIDRAMTEARDALSKDPSDQFLSHHLAQQRRAKLALLRQANQMARAGL